MMTNTVVLFLHGSGGTGIQLRTFLETAPINLFGQSTFRGILDAGMSCYGGKRTGPISLVTPTSELRPYTPMGGELLNVWFDRSPQFVARGLDDVEDISGVDASINKLLPTLRDLESKFDNIFIGGFSMGGGLSLHFLRQRLSNKVRGVFSLGSFLVSSSAVITSTLPSTSLGIPVLMMHGEDDSFIGVDLGRKTAANLLLQGVNVQFRSYKDVDHEIGPEQLRDLLYWMEDILTTQNTDSSEVPSTSSPSPARFVAGKKSGENDFDENEMACEVSPLTTLVASAEAQQEATTLDRANKLPGVRDIETSPDDLTGSLPYWFQKTPSSSSFVIHFRCPAESVELLCARSVMACGAEFLITSDEQGEGVKTVVFTSDPHKTAQEIGKRLFVRLGQGDTAGFSPCPVS